MQVECPQCEAVYNFDPTTIPAEGYDAQCTACQAVFFVQPPTPEPEPEPEPPENADINIECPECQTCYSFSPDAIPAEGYDAQCTECDALFFVRGRAGVGDRVEAGPQAATLDEAVVQPVSENTEPNALASAISSSVTDPSLAVMSGEPVGQDPAMALYGEPAQNVSDLLSFGDSLGEPEDVEMAGSMEDDFEAILVRKRKRLMVGFGSVGGVLLLGLLMYLVTPGIFDATIGPYLGIKARINPEAIPFVEQGVQRMLDDVPLAYDEAIVKFEEALAIDRDYPQAIGLVTLAYMFRGADLKAKAQSIRAKAEEKITKITKLQKRAGRSRRIGPKIRDLRSAVQELSDRSTKVNEEGAAKFTKGQKWAKEGMKKFAEWPLVVMSSGLLQFEADPDKLQAAEKFMKAGKKYLGKKKGDKALDEAFAAMLDARILQRMKKEPKQAISLLRNALTKEERFQRARYMLALLLAESGEATEAKKEAQRILDAVEDHKGAKEVLGT